jgi:hypothetical protein
VITLQSPAKAHREPNVTFRYQEGTIHIILTSGEAKFIPLKPQNILKYFTKKLFFPWCQGYVTTACPQVSTLSTPLPSRPGVMLVTDAAL